MKPIDKHDRALICRLGMWKLLAVMALVLLPATGFSQTVRFSDRNLTLQQAFQEIERQTELTFAYNAGVLDVTSVVSLPSRQMNVKDALDILLEGRNVDYEITNGQVIITKRETGPVHVYSGTVTDETDAPIYGAVVMIRGGQRACHDGFRREILNRIVRRFRNGGLVSRISDLRADSREISESLGQSPSRQ